MERFPKSSNRIKRRAKKSRQRKWQPHLENLETRLAMDGYGLSALGTEPVESAGDLSSVSITTTSYSAGSLGDLIDRGFIIEPDESDPISWELPNTTPIGAGQQDVSLDPEIGDPVQDPTSQDVPSFNEGAYTGSDSKLSHGGTSSLPGDYNLDGVVSAADYTVMRNGGMFTPDDYNLWKDNYEQVQPNHDEDRHVADGDCGDGTTTPISQHPGPATKPTRIFGTAGEGYTDEYKDGNGDVVRKIKYSEDGNIRERVEINPSTGERVTTSFDSQGHPDRHVTTDDDGTERKIETFDDDGRRTRVQTFDEDGIPEDDLRFRYDEDGNLDSVNRAGLDNGIEETIEVDRDENGNTTYTRYRLNEGGRDRVGSVTVDRNGNVVVGEGDRQEIFDAVPDLQNANRDTHAETDENGVTTTVRRNPDGSWDVTVTDASGRVISLQYLSSGPCPLGHDPCPLESPTASPQIGHPSLDVGLFDISQWAAIFGDPGEHVICFVNTSDPGLIDINPADQEEGTGAPVTPVMAGEPAGHDNHEANRGTNPELDDEAKEAKHGDVCPDCYQEYRRKLHEIEQLGISRESAEEQLQDKSAELDDLHSQLSDLWNELDDLFDESSTASSPGTNYSEEDPLTQGEVNTKTKYLETLEQQYRNGDITTEEIEEKSGEAEELSRDKLSEIRDSFQKELEKEISEVDKQADQAADRVQEVEDFLRDIEEKINNARREAEELLEEAKKCSEDHCPEEEDQQEPGTNPHLDYEMNDIESGGSVSIPNPVLENQSAAPEIDDMLSDLVVMELGPWEHLFHDLSDDFWACFASSGTPTAFADLLSRMPSADGLELLPFLGNPDMHDLEACSNAVGFQPVFFGELFTADGLPVVSPDRQYVRITPSFDFSGLGDGESGPTDNGGADVETEAAPPLPPQPEFPEIIDLSWLPENDVPQPTPVPDGTSIPTPQYPIWPYGPIDLIPGEPPTSDSGLPEQALPVPDDTAPGSTLGDDDMELIVNWNGEGLSPGQSEVFRVDLDNGYSDVFPFPDYRDVLFELPLLPETPEVVDTESAADSGKLP